MNKIILLLISILLVSTPCMAQTTKRAQKKMNQFNYFRATIILNKAVLKPKQHDEAVPMLAECYRLQHDPENSKVWYGQAIGLPSAKPVWVYYYAQALRTTGNYAQAREMFAKYNQLEPGDHRGAAYAACCDSVMDPWKNHLPGFEVKNVSAINSPQSDFGPAFYKGSLVFASDRTSVLDENLYGWTERGYLDLLSADPVSQGEFWGNMKSPSSFKGVLNQAFHDGPATFSGDTLVYFTRTYHDKAKRKNNFRTNLLKIFYSTCKNGKWGTPAPFYLNSPDYSVGHPALSVDGKTLYFASDMPGGHGGTDLWMCKRNGNSWGKPENLDASVNTPGDEMFPSIQLDGSLLFASDGLPGYGSLDIFYTKLVNSIWSSPVNLGPPINSSYDDFAMNYAPGTKNGFFSSSRPGGIGNDDIYAFRQIDIPASVNAPETVKTGIPEPAYISGIVKDKNSMQAIPGATIFLFDPNTGKVRILKTDKDGRYRARVSRPSEMTAKAMMPKYIADCSPFLLAEIKPGTTTEAPRDLLLDKLEMNKAFRIENIYYDFDKYNIRADAQPELDKIVRIMNENPIAIELGSHTDCRGSFAYNDNLSQNRAESAVRYIVFKGINSSRITAKGYGKHQLTNKCADGVPCTSEEHQANRRTEFKVIGYNGNIGSVEQFNPDNFKDGEEIEAYDLPAGFYNPCK